MIIFTARCQPIPASRTNCLVHSVAAGRQYQRFGYRRVAAWLDEGDKKIWRLWSRMGLSLPKRPPRRRRTGTDIRLRNANRPNSFWSYDFVHDKTANGRASKLLRSDP